MSKADADKHEAALTASQYHKNGACIVRHSSGKGACDYLQNGYDITLSARASLYNAPQRFPPEEILNVTPEARNLSKKKVVSPAAMPAPGQPFDGTLWNIGVHDNFKPGRAEWPYLHNWHHMVANKMLIDALYDKKEGYAYLEQLMAVGYNLNGPRNIVLLPQQERVGRVVRWPIHPNNHMAYDEYVRSKLGDIKRRMQDAPDDCDAKKKAASGVKENIERISDNVLQLLSNLVGTSYVGKHINLIQQYGDQLAQKLGLAW